MAKYQSQSFLSLKRFTLIYLKVLCYVREASNETSVLIADVVMQMWRPRGLANP